MNIAYWRFWVLSYIGVWVLAIVWAVISGIIMRKRQKFENASDGGIALLSLGTGMLAVGLVANGLKADWGVFIILVWAGGAGIVVPPLTTNNSLPKSTALRTGRI